MHTTISQSRLGSNGNEWILRIAQSFRNGSLQSESLVSYPGHLLGWRGSYPSAKPHSAYSIAPADWTLTIRLLYVYLQGSSVHCNINSLSLSKLGMGNTFREVDHRRRHGSL